MATECIDGHSQSTSPALPVQPGDDCRLEGGAAAVHQANRALLRFPRRRTWTRDENIAEKLVAPLGQPSSSTIKRVRAGMIAAAFVAKSDPDGTRCVHDKQLSALDTAAKDRLSSL